MVKHYLYKIGNYYVMYSKEKYQKIKILDITIETMKDGNEFYFFGVSIKYEVFKNRQPIAVQSNDLDSFKAWPLERDTHCWNCGDPLCEIYMDLCKKCGWIACPDDNACGCNYKQQEALDYAWYRNYPTKTNDELGIFKIIKQSYALTEAQRASGMVGRVTVDSLAGKIYLSIWNSKAGDGTLKLRPDHSQKTEDGRFLNTFIPSKDFRAFILQWAEDNSIKSELYKHLPISDDDFEIEIEEDLAL
jgi:hypothetical protein